MRGRIFFDGVWGTRFGKWMVKWMFFLWMEDVTTFFCGKNMVESDTAVNMHSLVPSVFCRVTVNV